MARHDDDREGLAFAHFNARLMSRYGIEISKPEWRRLGTDVAGGRCHSSRATYNGDLEAWVTIEGVDVAVYYSTQHRCLKTVFALPPPRDGVRRAMPPCMATPPRIRDRIGGAWYRARAREAADLLFVGDMERARAMLDGIAGIPPQASSEIADAHVRAHVARVIGETMESA